MKRYLLILLALVTVVLTACTPGKTTDRAVEPETEKTATSPVDVGATTDLSGTGEQSAGEQTVTEPTDEPTDEPTAEPTTEPTVEPTTVETPSAPDTETPTDTCTEVEIEPDTLYQARIKIDHMDENGFGGDCSLFDGTVYVKYSGASSEFGDGRIGLLGYFLVDITFYGRNCRKGPETVEFSTMTGGTEEVTFDHIVDEIESYETAGIDFPIVVYKPIIYLYPEEDTVCSVALDFQGELTCTYPAYGEDGWSDFIAKPDGTLIFPDGSEYYALYWEGECDISFDFSSGFCVKGEDTAAFLEKILPQMGLNAREANEFIVYWLPRMQNNAYNLISFQTETYTDNVHLNVSPAPDTCIRVFMAYKALEAPVDLPVQSFDAPARTGFTLVEWGGSELSR